MVLLECFGARTLCYHACSHQASQILPSTVAPTTGKPCSRVVQWVGLSQVQDLAFAPADCHKAPESSFFQPVKVDTFI